MNRTVTYYFTMVSPWSWLGHAAFLDTARRHGVQVDFRPVDFGMVFSESGGLPLARRHPLRRHYRLVELQRWRERRGLPLVLEPRHFPCPSDDANRSVLALVEAGTDPAGYMNAVFRAVWAEERDISDTAVLASLLEAAGFDAVAVLERAASAEIGELYAANGRKALADGVFGAPSYVLDGEAFWGQDRIELLDEALATGRAAFLPA